jgi:competence protein ComEA
MFKDILLKYRISFVFLSISFILFLIGSRISTSRSKNDSSMIFITKDATASSSLNQVITVDIEGEVINPGIYSLPSESRIQDLIDKSGGLTDEANVDWISKFLNKAQKLSDSDKVYIPSVREEISSKNSPVGVKQLSISGKVNINTASKEELESLSGVGEKTAEKIVAGRPYNAPGDLLDKKILGNATFEKIKDLISTL